MVRGAADSKSWLNIDQNGVMETADGRTKTEGNELTKGQQLRFIPFVFICFLWSECRQGKPNETVMKRLATSKQATAASRPSLALSVCISRRSWRKAKKKQRWRQADVCSVAQS